MGMTRFIVRTVLPVTDICGIGENIMRRLEANLHTAVIVVRDWIGRTGLT